MDAKLAGARVTLFEVRAFDVRGGYDSQRWTVVVANVNRPPTLLPIGNYQIREGRSAGSAGGGF